MSLIEFEWRLSPDTNGRCQRMCVICRIIEGVLKSNHPAINADFIACALAKAWKGLIVTYSTAWERIIPADSSFSETARSLACLAGLFLSIDNSVASMPFPSASSALLDYVSCLTEEHSAITLQSSLRHKSLSSRPHIFQQGRNICLQEPCVMACCN